jgi:hypothetical protein
MRCAEDDETSNGSAGTGRLVRDDWPHGYSASLSLLVPCYLAMLIVHQLYESVLLTLGMFCPVCSSVLSYLSVLSVCSAWDTRRLVIPLASNKTLMWAIMIQFVWRWGKALV